MKIEWYINDINNTSFFRDLDEKSLLELFSNIDYSIVEYKKDDVIFFENDECENLSIILRGSIQIQKIDAMGRVLTVAEFGALDTFGENLIFGDKNRFPMAVISKNDTAILHIKKESVIKLCQENRTFLYEFLRSVSNKAFVLSSRLKEVTLKTIRQKICEFLIWQYSIQNSTKLKIDMSKKEWADRIGVQRPSLSRELIKMKEEGLIDYDRDTITIKKIENLKDYTI